MRNAEWDDGNGNGIWDGDAKYECKVRSEKWKGKCEVRRKSPFLFHENENAWKTKTALSALRLRLSAVGYDAYHHRITMVTMGSLYYDSLRSL